MRAIRLRPLSGLYMNRWDSRPPGTEVPRPPGIGARPAAGGNLAFRHIPASPAARQAAGPGVGSFLGKLSVPMHPARLTRPPRPLHQPRPALRVQVTRVAPDHGGRVAPDLLAAGLGRLAPAVQEVSLMASGSGSAAQPGLPPASGEAAGYPFRGPGLAARVIPFAAVAVLAEASLALPPGPRSQPAVIASAVLLLATAAEFGLPWPRLPGWTSVLVPLTYTGSALALILAAGATSGVGLALLIPVLWTGQFHRR